MDVLVPPLTFIFYLIRFILGDIYVHGRDTPRLKLILEKMNTKGMLKLIMTLLSMQLVHGKNIKGLDQKVRSIQRFPTRTPVEFKLDSSVNNISLSTFSYQKYS